MTAQGLQMHVWTIFVSGQSACAACALNQSFVSELSRNLTRLCPWLLNHPVFVRHMPNSSRERTHRSAYIHWRYAADASFHVLGNTSALPITSTLLGYIRISANNTSMPLSRCLYSQKWRFALCFGDCLPHAIIAISSNAISQKLCMP